MEHYYSIYFDFDLSSISVKGTYAAAIIYAETVLKEKLDIHNYTIDKPLHACKDILYTIEQEDDEECFLDTVYYAGRAIVDKKDRRWVLEHRDDFYDILNKDGTCKQRHLY